MKLRTRLSSSKMFNSAGRPSYEKKGTQSVAGDTVFNNQSFKVVNKEAYLAVPEVRENSTTSGLQESISSNTSCESMTEDEGLEESQISCSKRDSGGEQGTQYIKREKQAPDPRPRRRNTLNQGAKSG